jgi:FkbM family methyltransferase
VTSKVKRFLREIALLPLRLAAAYSRLLSEMSSELGYAWGEMVSVAISAKTTEVVHAGGSAEVNIGFYTPNALCRFRARTFSTKEPETLEWLDRYGQLGDLFDVGANVGLYSIYYAKTHSGLAYAFEPSVFNLSMLAKNIYLNGLSDRIIVVPNPLTSCNTIADFNLSEMEQGGALSTFGEKFGQDGQPLKQVMNYQTTGFSLDFLLNSGILPHPPALMKIDVDGIEHLILSGAKDVLVSQSLRTVLIEVNDDFREHSTGISSILTEAGFRMSEKRHAHMFDGGPYAQSYNQIWVKG